MKSGSLTIMSNERDRPLLGENRYTHIYISAIYVYIYIIYLFETIVSKAWPPSSVFFINYKYTFSWGSILSLRGQAFETIVSNK